MLKLILSHLYSDKNKLIIFIYIVLTLVIIIAPLPFDLETFELFYYKENYQTHYNEMILELFKIIIPVFIIMISLEHDNKYINNLTTYKKRSLIIINKIFIYTYIIFINLCLIMLFYVCILKMFNFYILFDQSFFESLMHIFLDSILILYLNLLLIKEKNKKFSFIILIGYLLLNIYSSSNDMSVLYYLLPVLSNNYLKNKNIVNYKLIYILLIIYLNIIKYSEEEI